MEREMIDEFVEIMDYIWKNDQKTVCTEEHLKKEFPESYEKFDRFSRGVQPHYATEHGNDKIFRLSGEGMRKLVEMKKMQEDSKKAKTSVNLQKNLIFLTAIYAFSSIAQLFLQPFTNIFVEGTVIVITILFILGVGRLILQH